MTGDDGEAVLYCDEVLAEFLGGTVVSVSSLADTIEISQIYLNKCFQKELGVSVQRFIIDFRLNRAANLLVSTSDSITEIAALVGYNDPLVFSRSFKKKFNKSPN